MKRIYSLYFILLSLGIFGLFQVKFMAQALHREISNINMHIKEERENLHILKAEWTFLNSPERLKRLSGKYLSLDSVGVASLKSLDNGNISDAIKVDSAKKAYTDKDILSVIEHRRATKWNYKNESDHVVEDKHLVSSR